jgi:hypothetical protein
MMVDMFVHGAYACEEGVEDVPLVQRSLSRTRRSWFYERGLYVAASRIDHR